MNLLKKIIPIFTAGKKSERIGDLQAIHTTSSDQTNITTTVATDTIILDKFRLIWLDSNIDKLTYNDYVNTISQLQQEVTMISPFTNVTECVDFIINNQDEKIFLIISEKLSEVLFNPNIQNNHQVLYIYIFPGSDDQYQQWPKVKGVYKDITSICRAIKLAVRESDRNSISLCYLNTDYETQRDGLDELDQSFMYTEIFKEILLTINFKPKHITDFIEYYRKAVADNDVELKKVEKFEKEYDCSQSIWWYTFNSFLYALVNKALRTMDIDLIIVFGFFIQHLHENIKELCVEQCTKYDKLETFTVYRGQGLSKKDFVQMKQREGGLFAFNNFLSTTHNESAALAYAESNSINRNTIGVLFVMEINRSNSSTYFADISQISNFDGEEEIVFSMHSVFRIGTVQPYKDSQLWQVNLTLTSDDDDELDDVTDCILEEIKEREGWLRLGRLMIKLGYFNEAKKLCEKLLGEITDQKELADLINLLGMVEHAQGEYMEAITLYRTSVTLKRDVQLLNDPDWADSFSNFGHVYHSIGKYAKALSFYELALDIHLENSSKDLDLATAYYNIGMVYHKMKDGWTAHFYYDKAMKIMKKTIPRSHPNWAYALCNIYSMSEENILFQRTYKTYKELFQSYRHVLDLQGKILPPNHPELAISYTNIGRTFENTYNYHEAELFYKMAFEIQTKILSPNHLDLAISYNNIGRIMSEKGKYSDACVCHRNALIIQEKNLPLNHTDVITSYEALASAYYQMKQYSEALPLYVHVLDILLVSMSKTDPQIVQLELTISLIKFRLFFPRQFRKYHQNLFTDVRSLPVIQVIVLLLFIIFILYYFSPFKILICAIIFYICCILMYIFCIVCSVT